MDLGVIPKGAPCNGKNPRLSEQIAKLDTGVDMSVGRLMDVFASEAWAAGMTISQK